MKKISLFRIILYMRVVSSITSLLHCCYPIVTKEFFKSKPGNSKMNGMAPLKTKAYKMKNEDIPVPDRSPRKEDAF